jgi:uncharacterized membrane protein
MVIRVNFPFLVRLVDRLDVDVHYNGMATFMPELSIGVFTKTGQVCAISRSPAKNSPQFFNWTKGGNQNAFSKVRREE